MEDLASEFYRYTADACEEEFGDRHHLSLQMTAAHALEFAFGAPSNHEKANSLLQQVQETTAEVYGPSSYEAISSMLDRCSALESQNKYDEARDIYDEAVRLTPEEEPATKQVLVLCIELLITLADYVAAEVLARRLLHLEVKTSGETGMSFSKTMDTLIRILSQQGTHDAALDLRKRQVELAREYLIEGRMAKVSLGQACTEWVHILEWARKRTWHRLLAYLQHLL